MWIRHYSMIEIRKNEKKSFFSEMMVNRQIHIKKNVFPSCSSKIIIKKRN